LPKANVLRGQADNISLAIYNAGSGAPRSNINTNKVIDLKENVVARIQGGLSGRLACGSMERKRNRCHDIAMQYLLFV
jgi:hypothetical protein